MVTKKVARTRVKKEETPAVDRSQAQREKIHKVAARLFLKKSYLGTSIEDIAQAANVNKATIYYYFKNKNQILYDVLVRFTKEFNEQARVIKDSDATSEKKLELLVYSHVRWLASHPSVAGISQLYKSLTPKLMRSFIDIRSEYEIIFREVLGELMVKNGSKAVEPKIATFFTIGMLNYINQWYRTNGALSDEELAARALTFIKKAIS